MSHEDVLSLLGLTRKAGRLEMGEEPTGAVCRSRKAAVVLLAEDAAPNTCRRAAHFGELGKCLWLPLPCSKAELGRSLGRSSCAMLAVTDAGFAAALVKKLRTAMPDIALRTTVMVGFPGETEADFQVLLDFLAQARFEWVGCFPYSQEADTPAATLPNPVEPVKSILSVTGASGKSEEGSAKFFA